jgi:hypothetical protein
MKGNIRIVLVVAVLALAALACQAMSGGGDSRNNNPPSNVPPSAPTDGSAPLPVKTDAPQSPPSTGKVILSDDFSSAEQWGTGTDSDSAVEYVNEALNFIVYTEGYFVWSTPDNEVYQNVHIEANVVNNGTDSTTAFGFICDKSEGNDFYYLVMTPAGQYVIALASDGGKDVFLTNNDAWADSDLIAVNANTYHVGADCGNGALTLYVDGKKIASVNDSTYASGHVALLVWSGDEAGMTNNVSFDDFMMSELP